VRWEPRRTSGPCLGDALKFQGLYSNSALELYERYGARFREPVPVRWIAVVSERKLLSGVIRERAFRDCSRVHTNCIAILKIQGWTIWNNFLNSWWLVGFSRICEPSSNIRILRVADSRNDRETRIRKVRENCRYRFRETWTCVKLLRFFLWYSISPGPMLSRVSCICLISAIDVYIATY
jgi:hypothetical protein